MQEFSWVAFSFAVVLSLAWTVFMYRMRKGKYRIIGSTTTASFFKTSVGEFRLDSKHGRLQVKDGKNGWTGIDLTDIRELSFQRSEEPAWLWEFLTGFNLWDFSGRYRDQNILWEIAAVRTNGTSIPLYKASQLEEREFWIWGWWVNIIRSSLEFVKLSKDADNHSRKVYYSLKEEFQRLGVRV